MEQQQAAASTSGMVAPKKPVRDFFCFYQGEGQQCPYMQFDLGAEDGKIFFFLFYFMMKMIYVP